MCCKHLQLPRVWCLDDQGLVALKLLVWLRTVALGIVSSNSKRMSLHALARTHTCTHSCTLANSITLSRDIRVYAVAWWQPVGPRVFRRPRRLTYGEQRSASVVLISSAVVLVVLRCLWLNVWGPLQSVAPSLLTLLSRPLLVAAIWQRAGFCQGRWGQARQDHTEAEVAVSAVARAFGAVRLITVSPQVVSSCFLSSLDTSIFYWHPPLIFWCEAWPLWVDPSILFDVLYK